MAIQPLMLALPLLLAAQEDPSATSGDPTMDRLVGGLSRSAKVVFFVPDCGSTLRRMRRVPAVEVVGRLASDELRDRAAEYASHMSLFVPPIVLSSAPALFDRIEGGVALSVEGFVVDQGVARPDVLLVADEAGLESVVPSLIALAHGDENAAEMVRSADLPFELGDRRPRVGVSQRGVLIVEVTTRSGLEIALAQHDGRVVAARSSERVSMALARLAAPVNASILGSSRFRDAMGAVHPKPGDVVWYADLRRLRHEEAFVMAPSGLVRSLFVDYLSDMDGLAVAIRGVGETCHGRAFLERGRWASRGTGPGVAGLFARQAEFEFPRKLSSPVSAAMAFHVDPMLAARVAGKIAEVFLRSGTAMDALAPVVEPVGGEMALSSLASHLRSEAVFFQPEGAFSGETLIRLGMALRIRNQPGVQAWFEKLVSAGTVRAVDVRGKPAWEVRLSSVPPLSPVFSIRDGWLVCANHIFALRRILDRWESAQPLIADDSFHAPFDRLDRSVVSSGLMTGYVDSSRVAQSFATWLGGMRSLFWVTFMNEDDWEWMDEVRELADDPEVQESLHGMAIQCRQVPSGYLLEVVGP